VSIIEEAFKKYVGRRGNFSNLIGSSRTDAGVHALRNTIHVDISRQLTSSSAEDTFNNFFDTNALKQGLNYFLHTKHSHIYITDVQNVPQSFHARYDAVSRTYLYRIMCPVNHNSLNCSNLALFHTDRSYILRYPIDLNKMRNASNCLIGEMDFSSFRNSTCQSNSPIRNVKEITFYSSLEDEPANSRSNINDLNTTSLLDPNVHVITMKIVADSFLQKMVRNIVGALVHSSNGQSQCNLETLSRLLALKDRSKVMARPAPPQGLYLADVHYDWDALKVPKT